MAFGLMCLRVCTCVCVFLCMCANGTCSFVCVYLYVCVCVFNLARRVLVDLALFTAPVTAVHCLLAVSS
jgi:hypothetical protein